MIVDNSLYFLGHPVYRRTAIKQFAIWRTTKQAKQLECHGWKVTLIKAAVVIVKLFLDNGGKSYCSKIIRWDAANVFHLKQRTVNVGYAHRV